MLFKTAEYFSPQASSLKPGQSRQDFWLQRVQTRKGGAQDLRQPTKQFVGGGGAIYTGINMRDMSQSSQELRSLLKNSNESSLKKSATIVV